MMIYILCQFQKENPVQLSLVIKAVLGPHTYKAQPPRPSASPYVISSPYSAENRERIGKGCDR